jgi:hypothetical protein
MKIKSLTGETTDWADLRARAAKLDSSLSELQQRERQKKPGLLSGHNRMRNAFKWSCLVG